MHPEIIKFDTIESTHRFAIALAEGNDARECVIMANQQSKGIGRCQREWISDHGNLFTSIIKKLLEATDFGKLSLATACAIHESILNYVPDNLYLHWPNDIYYKNLKISGILMAVVNHWLIISVGININSSPEIDTAASIREITKSKIPPLEILGIVLVNMDRWFCYLRDFGFFYIKNYWLRYINKINCKVIIKNGRDSLSGIFTGIDDLGRLILDKNGKNLFISSGDMFINMESVTVNYE